MPSWPAVSPSFPSGIADPDASGGGGGDFALTSDDASNTTTATNGVLATVGFNVGAGTASSFVAELIDKPPGSALNSGSLTVVDADPANPDVTFTPDALGRFVVRLVATDASANDAQDATVVQVSPDPPRLSAPSSTSGGVDGNVVNVTFTNDGGAVASTAATLVKPEGSAATLTHSTPNLTASYTPDVPGVYGVEMSGTNGDGTSPKVIARRSVESRAPTAEAGANQSDVAPGTVNLSSAGSAVNGASGGSLTYLWAFVSDDTATLSSATAASPTFTGVIDESYIVQLTVTDTETGESATDIVSVVMQATPMPAQYALCDILTDTTDVVPGGAGTFNVYENDGTTLKIEGYYNAGGNSAGGDTYEVSEANGAYLSGLWSGSGASVNRRFVLKPQFPGATLNYDGRIIVCALFYVVVDGSSGTNPGSVRLLCAPADLASDFNSAGHVGVRIDDTGAIAWYAVTYPTTTESASATATGSETTDPSAGRVLVCWAQDEAANIKVKIGATSIPTNINDVVWDFESAGTVGATPAAGASNPWAGGVAISIYLNNKYVTTRTVVACEQIAVWTD